MNIGDVVYVPRVYEEHKEETIEVDGKVYNRTFYELTPVAKEKMIIKIVTIVTENNTDVEYYSVNTRYKDNYSYPCRFSDEVFFYEPEPALIFAQEWLRTEKRTLYGISHL